MSNPPTFFSPDEDKPEDFVDEKDDCIICGKLLLEHSEQQGNECYNNLVKRRLFRQELRKK